MTTTEAGELYLTLTTLMKPDYESIIPLTAEIPDVKDCYKWVEAKKILGKSDRELQEHLTKYKIPTYSKSHVDYVLKKFIDEINKIGKIEKPNSKIVPYNKAIKEKKHFAFETNLHLLEHLEFVTEAKENGFLTYLVFFFMPNAKSCVERVRIRLKTGGHGLPASEIAYRYKAGLRNLKNQFSTFDKVLVYDTSKPYQITFIAEIISGQVIRANRYYLKSNPTIARYIPVLNSK
ncbi:MAG: hypothetical protein SH857_14975 [Chitinophagales bacterium]|nr:hypothetical protein [Chitinophagales bacterium]